MGNILYGKKKINSKEQLEAIQEEINRLDAYKSKSFIREKNSLELIYIIFILIYTIGLAYIYFIFDKNNQTVILYSLLFIISLPVVVYLIRKYLHFYFKWISENTNVRLIELLKEKKRILSKVQETETFNDAKSILEKYDPSLLRNLSLSLNNLSQIDATPTRDRRTSTFSHQQQQQINSNNSRQSPRNRLSGRSLPPQTYRNYMTLNNNSNHQQQQQRIDYAASPNPTAATTIGYGQRTIKPILPQNRSTIEKVIDYMFNDGPNNRYALICHHCYSHNGMALPEEFEYIAYICAYCGTFNPSRKIRPTAPKVIQQAIEAAPTSSATKTSQSDSTNENLKIFELSTELNKTSTPHVQEPDDDKNENETKTTDVDKTIETEEQTKTNLHKIDEKIRSIDSSSDEE